MYYDLYNKEHKKIGRIFIDENIATDEEIEHIKQTCLINSNENNLGIDKLTNLPIRTVLMKHLIDIKEDAMLLLVSLNFFSYINDFYGRDIADSILKQKSQEYAKMINDDNVFLFRLNVSEFAILVKDKALFEKYYLLMEHYILTNNECFIKELNNQKIIVSQTVGLAYGTERLLSMADVALKSAITTNQKFCVYKDGEHDKSGEKENFDNIAVYKDALESNNIYPFFQPIVEASNGKIVKYEALARIIDEEGNIISPYKFLKAAESDKTYEYFTRQMLQKTFNIYSKNDIQITINLTYENVVNSSLVSYIKNRLDNFGGDKITFEIIESEDIKDYKIIEEFILMVKEYGCKIAIDDFGSGYSNFTNIIKINTDYIKLDGSLVESLNSDKSVEMMVESLMRFTKGAGIKTIAEFVSTQEIADKAREMGIDYFQGFLYGKPEKPEFYGFVV